MKRIVAGGTGFIGQRLIKHWLQQGKEIIVIGRDDVKINRIFPEVEACTWQRFESNFENLCSNCECIVNLTGANIGEKQWSQHRKQEILNSRVHATEIIAKACAQLKTQAPTLLNASAIGIYGLQSNVADGLPAAMDESTTVDCQHPKDFLSEVGCAWEKATAIAKQNNVRVVNMRFGVVLAKDGGVLPRIAMPFYFCLGGPIGSGQQPFTWIHWQDLLNAIDFIYKHPHITGPVNCVAPNSVPQKQFAALLAKALKRPAIVPTPAFALKWLFGQMAEELLLRGQHVYPKKLIDMGFRFQYPELEAAFTAIYGTQAQ